MLILKIMINNVIYSWLRSLFRSQNVDVYLDINMFTNINMTTYQYKCTNIFKGV